MTETEQKILAALVELDDAVRVLRTANPKPDLQPLFARLDELTEQLPAGADPQLRHYLVRKSYEKARLLREGRDAENARGACG
jgi:hypothetical protein